MTKKLRSVVSALDLGHAHLEMFVPLALAALLISLGIALVSAAAATILGTLAALALTRGGRFRGRVAFSAMSSMRNCGK